MAVSFPTWFPIRGFSLINGNTLNRLFNRPQVSVDNAITATAAGTKANAYKLSAALNRVSVCATNGDSVKLPPSADLVGTTITIINDGAANLQVFGDGTDTIDAVVTVTGVTLTAARRAQFFCSARGIWQSMYGLKSA